MSMQNKTVIRALSAALLSSTALVASHQAFAAEATVLEAITVEGQSVPAIITTDVHRTDVAPTADGGSFLKSIPGIDAVRMGGHGLDPVIRGQQQEQLNIISDGAFVYGGCPNRMDPPAALTAIETYDSVTVEKGFQSVRHGPGGSGGTVILERNAPSLDAVKPYQIKAGVAVNSNGGGVNSNLDMAVKAGSGYIRALGTKSRASDYEDGKGKKVRSAFKQWSGGLDIGWTPGNGTELSFSAERDRTDDVLFAGAGMDAPYGITDVVRLKFKTELDGTAQALRFNAYDSRVDHLMDNYSLRAFGGGMYMRTPTTSNTTGFKAEVDIDAGDIPMLVGMDFKRLDRDAVRYSGMNASNVNTTQSVVWPGITSREIGLFGEGTMALDKAATIKVGLRYDNVRVTADTADVVATVGGGQTRSANQLYTMYYGHGFTTQVENNVSGLIRYQQKMDADTTVYASAARSVRTANTVERAMAADMANATMRRVGNPNINPEEHYQIDFGGDAKIAGVNVSASAYYDYVKDFIFRDVARGQAGMAMSDSAVVYRNIDATLMGVDLTANHTFTNQVSLNGSFSYVRGQNEESNSALPQIPPLKVSMDVSYPMSDWLLGTRVSAASKQTRVDSSTATGSGRDVGKTAGYVTADLYASRPVGDSFEVGLGVTNVFDKTYANHLNKSNSFDNTETQVNEPGRSFYVRMTGEF
ncbi:TonB-dependent copper receptor [Pseudomonadota bacterium]